jgi:hypothetical protein
MKFARRVSMVVKPVVLAVLAGVFMPTAGHAGSTSNVNVVNTPNVNVANTPSVNVTNTPSVNVANTPTVNLAGGSGVNVSNPLDSQGKPSPLVTIEAAQPYEDRCSASTYECFFRTIPTGKRVVIQEVDTQVVLAAGARLNLLFFSNTAFNHSLIPILLNDDGTSAYFQSHQETRLNASPGSTPYCIGVASAGGFQNFTCTLSGFLVDTE